MFLGYKGTGYETIRHHLLQTEKYFKNREEEHVRLMFVEVEGLYMEGQGKRKSRKEEKGGCSSGWERCGKRTS